MYLLNDKEHLFALLAKKATVLTPNNRLSESIIQQYFAYCNNQTVEKPRCMPYNTALITAYEQLNLVNPHTSYPILLTNTQCQYLWRTLIKSQTNITYSEGLLQAVISAWERCQQWQISLKDPAFHYTAQTKQFQQWWQLAANQLEAQHLITEYQLLPYILDADSPLFSQEIIWVCFDDFTPQQLHVQEYLTKKGIKQYQYDLKEKPSTIEVLAAMDNKEEYQQLMAWLHLKIKQGNQRIAVVVPNLEQESPSLQRALADHFSPALFNISLGQPLSDFPVIAHALCWLNLDDKYLSLHQVNLLLQSPYLDSSKEEFMSRSEYLQESTLLKKQTVPLNKLVEELKIYAPKLANMLAELKPYPQETTIHEWIHLFQERLNHFGFPGDYGLNSENYQCVNRLMILFDELRQFALFHSSFSKIDALEILQHLAKNTIFQAQKTNAPIQICGLLEASGCEFDSLWFIGLTDQCLPQKVRLSAFIPPQLQRELHMPHSLPARELKFARQILQRLQNSADSLVYSYAQLEGDHPNLPCSLIANFPKFVLFPANNEQAQNPDLLITEERFHIPVLQEEPIAGGTAILSNQAKCPFKAFAEHRLHAKAVLETTDGLDHKERGKIIHKVMELLWQKLESQQNLVHLDPNILEYHIEQAIRTALAPLEQEHPDFIQEIESVRLKRLVKTSMEWEKQRPPFAIAALEQSYSINLAGLDFQVRVDRLDQVADKKWVIDYKSSLPAGKPWNEDRPKEPQLLIYALLDHQINTLLLMQLKAGKISCSGLSDEKQGISGITALKKEETWVEYRNTWQQQLTDLATEFLQGHCPPQPAHLTICQQCHLQNLCRFQADE